MSRFLFTLTALAAVVMATAATATAAPTVRQYEGTVVSVDRDARTFRLRDSERGTITIRVTRTTRFERVGGFAGLRRGLTNIEAYVRRSNGAWVARSVEHSGGGGDHGGSRDDSSGRDSSSGHGDSSGRDGSSDDRGHHSSGHDDSDRDGGGSDD